MLAALIVIAAVVLFFIIVLARTIKVIPPAGNVYSPSRTTLLGGLLADDGEIQRFERAPHFIRRNVEPDFLADVVMCDNDLALPRHLATDLESWTDHFSASGFDDEVDRTPGRFQRRMRINTSLVAIRGIRRQTEFT